MIICFYIIGDEFWEEKLSARKSCYVKDWTREYFCNQISNI